MFRRRKPGEPLDAELRFHLEQQMKATFRAAMGDPAETLRAE